MRAPRSRALARSRLLLGAASTILVLAAVEGVSRLFLSVPSFHHDMPIDPVLGYRMRPNLQLTNQDEEGAFPFALSSLGFRGPELPAAGAAPPPDVTRVAFLGDSFLAAWQVREPQLMTTRTAQLMEGRGTPSTVYNLSADDFGTAQELLMLREYGGRIIPHVIVLALFPGNDVINNSLALSGWTEGSPGDYLRPYLEEAREGGLTQTYMHPGRAFLRRHMRSFAIAERRLLATGAARNVSWLQAPRHDVESTEQRIRQGQAPMEELEILRPHPPEHRWEQGWRATRALVRAFKAEAEAMEARFLVLVIPMEMQVQHTARAVDTDYLTRFYGRAEGLDGVVDWNLPELRLQGYFKEDGIPSVMLLPRLREATERTGTTHYAQGHLNGLGHAVAADAVVGFLAAGDPKGSDEPGSIEPREPVSLVETPERAPSALDFGTDAHAAYLDSGWWEWRKDWGGGIGGWAMARAGIVVLRPSGARLVVRGLLPPRAPAPYRFTVGIRSVLEKNFTLDAPGPFEVALDVNPLSPPGGYVPVFLAAEKPFTLADGDQREVGLIVSEVAFRP